MKPFQMLTWALVAFSITVAQPTLAQERGEETHESGSDERGGDDRGAADRGGQDRGDEGRERDRGDDGDDRSDRGSHATPVSGVRRVGTQNTTTAGSPISREELELTCGAGGWLETWLEDENGTPIPGTYEYDCIDW
jgi:hypothetical protein